MVEPTDRETVKWQWEDLYRLSKIKRLHWELPVKPSINPDKRVGDHRFKIQLIQDKSINSANSTQLLLEASQILIQTIWQLEISMEISTPQSLFQPGNAIFSREIWQRARRNCDDWIQEIKTFIQVA